MAFLKTKKINGLRVDELKACVADIEHDSSLARYQFRAVNKWVKGAQSESMIHNFSAGGKINNSRHRPHLIDADEPPSLLGHDKGANATEALLHALGACLNASFIYEASKAGIKIDELELDLRGDIDLRGFLDIDDTVRNGYERIFVTCKVKSDASEEQLRELCQAAQHRSPVFDIVSHPVPVTIEFGKI